MNADPQAVQALFARAIEIADRADRERFLTEQCGSDGQLYERVVKLLVAFDGSKGFLDQPTHLHATTPLETGGGYQAGHVISGRYKLLEAIGEGGMGTVWVAEQSQPVRRKVALKLVKPGMDSKQVLARFDAERQALALMDHPNIAKVFDGGVTDQGRPFFAMELVKGMPLTQYCDQMRLSVEERLKLFVPICQAIQHAHQKGIIHRDLKPSNVLICLYDGKPVPKVIDFGLAKAMHQPLTDQTVHTGFGLMIGTPLYMSPEQAEHNNLDVDTRSDVYSLGVMLYELLTGSTPLEKAQFKDAAFGEVLRLIKEVEPPKPSTRISSSAQLPNIAAQRKLEPSQLGRSIRGDLDWIVMKAIEKERERRYDTANGLARDIERFLNQEAVEACPPSAGYRLRRLARKYRVMIGTAAAFAMILVSGAGLSVWQAIRATKAESLASRRLVDVQAEQYKTEDALKTSQQSERRALESEAIAVAAREAEEQAKTAEAQQRQLAVQQRDEAKRLQGEATTKSNELQVLTEEQRRVIYVAEMNQVRIEAQRGNLGRMREILLEQLPIDGKEDLRGFEWNYWYRYLNQAKMLNRFEKATVDSRGSALVTVLPGGRQVAWTQGEATEIVDLQDGTSRRLPYRLRHYVDRTRFSDSGRAIVGACLSHTYPVGTYKPPGAEQGSSTSCSVIEPTGQVHTLAYPTDAFKHISALEISRDGSLAAVIGYDASHSKEEAATRICVWNVDSQQLVLNEVYLREINRISFSPDAKKMAAYLCHGTKRNADELRDVVVIIDVATGSELAVAQHDDDVDTLFWIPGSDRVLLSTLGFSGANRKQLMSWRIEKQAARPVLLTKETMPDYVQGAVSPDGSTLAITSHMVNNIRLVDTSRGDLVDTLQTDGKGIISLTYSGDGRQIIATTMTGEVLRWDIGKNNDLFALRTDPLPRIAKNGYALSQDQSLLAIALADGTLLTRTRDGVETKLRASALAPPSGSIHIRVSSDSHFLAILSKSGPDAAPLAKGKGLLEVYDLMQKRRLWQTYCTAGPDRFSFGGGSLLEFAADGEKLVQVGDTGTVVHDIRTGKGTAFDMREDSSSQRSAFLLMRRNPATGALYAAFYELLSEGVARYNVFDPVTGSKLHGCVIGQAGIPMLTPDGVYGVNPRPYELEFWDLTKGEKALSVPGFLAAISPDSQRLAVFAPTETSRSDWFSDKLEFFEISVWDLAGRRKLCGLPIAWNSADEARFSPDGKRLLTLEGRTSDRNRKVPRGRLWDVETGRELLDLPVAEQNHYAWDMFFDPSGQQLTQLLFSKTVGTIGGGATAFYDARPLEPAVDDALAATRLIDLLRLKLALKREWIADIESRGGLKPGIREAALAKVRDSIADPEQIAKLTGSIVGFHHRTVEDYQQALTWAEELHRLESNSVRSRTLLGAAYYRMNRLEDALRILMPSPSTDVPSSSEIEKGYEVLRQAVLALVHFRMGNKRESQVLLEAVSKPPSQIQEIFALALVGEPNALIPKRLLPTPDESMQTEERYKKTVNSLRSLFGNADIEFAKISWGAGYRLAAYDVDQDQRLSQEEMLQVLNDMDRYGKPISGMEDRYSIESQMEFLEETIGKSPHYLTARFVRAWIRATSPDPQFRDAGKSLEEAKAICELTKYRDATFLEALAAAYAASDDFSAAIHWQTTATNLYREHAISDPNGTIDPQNRLEAYRQHQVCSSKIPAGVSDLTVSLVPTRLQQQEVSVPIFAPDTVRSFKRIDGTDAAWSPDGTKIVRSIKSDKSGSVLEWIDIASRERQVICEDGLMPVWAASPFERIIFARSPQGVTRTLLNQSIWQCDPDGKGLAQVMEGCCPQLSGNDSLIVLVPKLQTFPPKFSAKGYRAELEGTWRGTGFEFEIQGIFSRLSPDGKLIAESNGELSIREVVSQRIVYPLDPQSRISGIVDGAWSPDSRFYAYGVLSNPNAAGLWLLDVATGENRLLADVNITNPSWSHDGGFIAADERGKNQIIIFDVGSLHLENGLRHLLQQLP